MEKKTKLDNLTDQEFADIIQAATSRREALANIGYTSYGTEVTTRLNERCNKLHLDTSHFEQLGNKHKLTDKEIFRRKSLVDRNTVVRRYRTRMDVPYACSLCGTGENWNGGKLEFYLDHLNGIANDNRIKNLRWLCPNCKEYEKMYHKNRAGIIIPDDDEDDDDE